MPKAAASSPLVVSDVGGRAGMALSQALSKRDAAISLCAIVLVALALRPAIVSIGPALPLISISFGLPHWVAALLTTIPDLLMGLLALPTPWLARRFGRDRLIVAALLLLTLSTAGRAFSPDVYVLLATTAGVGIGIAITGTLLSGVIKANFPTRAATVMGLCSTALSGAQIEEMAFDVATIVSRVSYAFELEIGDMLICTSAARRTPLLPALAAGDVCEVTIDGIGTLTNRLIA